MPSPGLGIKAKRFTEDNEGNEEFAPPGFEINATPPFVTLVSFCESDSPPFESRQSGLQKLTKATKSLPHPVLESTPRPPPFPSVNQIPRPRNQGKAVYRR